MHCLEVKNKAIYLDGVQVRGVTGYEIKSSAEHPTAELTLKLIVEESHILLNNGADDISGGIVTSTIISSSVK